MAARDAVFAAGDHTVVVGIPAAEEPVVGGGELVLADRAVLVLIHLLKMLAMTSALLAGGGRGGEEGEGGGSKGGGRNGQKRGRGFAIEG